ncbi:hypothetical protein V5O48_017378 [Marasmius crinis-equi]|uniref:Uncharacterized protein n=1 Tax=Marasmius crinis-equi TaxID=585013 RepID=A0ABR3EP56_9AGAR
MARSKDSPANTKQQGKLPTQPEDQSNNDLAAATGVSVTVVETLRGVARLTPVPYLSNISSVALHILQTVQTFKINKEGFKKLAGDVCELVPAINAACGNLVTNGKLLPEDLEAHLGQLSHIIKKIQTFVTQQTGRYRISRFLTRRSDSKAVHGYRGDLSNWLKDLRRQMDIINRESVTRMAEQQEADRAHGGPGGEVPNPEPIQAPDSSNFQTNPPSFNYDGFSGSISVNNVAGDRHYSSNENHSTITNSYNNVNLSGKRSPVRENGKHSMHKLSD